MSSWLCCAEEAATIVAASAQAEVVELRAQVAELKRRLAQNSRNSSRPPSSDGLAKPPVQRRRPSGASPAASRVIRAGAWRWSRRPTRSSITSRRCARAVARVSRASRRPGISSARCSSCRRSGCARSSTVRTRGGVGVGMRRRRRSRPRSPRRRSTGRACGARDLPRRYEHLPYTRAARLSSEDGAPVSTGTLGAFVAAARRILERSWTRCTPRSSPRRSRTSTRPAPARRESCAGCSPRAPNRPRATRLHDKRGSRARPRRRAPELQRGRVTTISSPTQITFVTPSGSVHHLANARRDRPAHDDAQQAWRCRWTICAPCSSCPRRTGTGGDRTDADERQASTATATSRSSRSAPPSPPSTSTGTRGVRRQTPPDCSAARHLPKRRPPVRQRLPRRSTTTSPSATSA